MEEQVESKMHHIKAEGHFQNISESFYEFLAEHKYTDCILSAGGEFVKAHKFILAGASPYLQRVFAMSGENDSIVIMPFEIGHGDLLSILEYIYTGKVELDVLKIAKFLNLAKLIELKGVTASSFGIDMISKSVIVQQKPSNSPQKQVTRLKRRPTSSLAQKTTPPFIKQRRTSNKTEMKCRHCPVRYENKSTMSNHERFCIHNPNRSSSLCPFCQKEVPPGSMTFHKRTKHGYVPNKRT